MLWDYVDFGNNQQGALGGSAQRINRLGNRWRLSFEMPPLKPEQAREWSAALVRGRRQGVRFGVLQPGHNTGAPGVVLVAGAGQAGAELDVDGATVGYVAKAGAWASINTGGRRYLHQIAQSVQFSETGTATLQIEPLLRVIPADNAPVELAAPQIEGLLAGVPAWGIDVDYLTRGFSFAIEEVA
jgi:hypothetical protein